MFSIWIEKINKTLEEIERIQDKYEKLHKYFKSWADIDISSWARWIICYQYRWQPVVKFYELHNVMIVKEFIERNKYNNPSIDKPYWFIL